MLATPHATTAAVAPTPRLTLRLRRSLWLLPLLASLLFVAGVLTWAYRADRAEREDRRATLIADALSSEAQLRDRLQLEQTRLAELARQLPALPRTPAGLAACG
jgi:two-component system, LuxR family, sensor histidine kinase DctS